MDSVRGRKGKGNAHNQRGEEKEGFDKEKEDLLMRKRVLVGVRRD